MALALSPAGFDCRNEVAAKWKYEEEGGGEKGVTGGCRGKGPDNVGDGTEKVGSETTGKGEDEDGVRDDGDEGDEAGECVGEEGGDWKCTFLSEEGGLTGGGVDDVVEAGTCPWCDACM